MQTVSSTESKSIFEIGQKIIIVAEGMISKSYQNVTPEIVNYLHFVELTITEERVVFGHHIKDKEHFGYKAKGSDGWTYLCQWKDFDDYSTSPYHNWQREYIEGIHFDCYSDGKIEKWLIPEKDFTDHYLNWDITQLKSLSKDFIVEHINNLFPSTQVTICKEVTNHNPEPVKLPFDHQILGLHYVSTGCFMCNHFKGIL